MEREAAVSEDELTFRAAYWPVLLLRALPALALAAFITFSSDHSPALGLAAFGAFAILSGLITAGLGARVLRGPAARLRTSALVQGSLTVVAGVAALLARDGGVLVLLYVVSVWAVVTGFLGSSPACARAVACRVRATRSPPARSPSSSPWPSSSSRRTSSSSTAASSSARASSPLPSWPSACWARTRRSSGSSWSSPP
ncbi:hypothetical protein [Clavibacter tessellarius]|uniref:hypothetical protein n=1 Tax=Clavibacter tessellarius TaxID=31965 RepID=UPI003252B184